MGQRASRLALLHKEGHLNFALTVTRGLEQQIQAAVIMEVTDQTMRDFIERYDSNLCISHFPNYFVCVCVYVCMCVCVCVCVCVYVCICVISIVLIIL